MPAAWVTNKQKKFYDICSWYGICPKVIKMNISFFFKFTVLKKAIKLAGHLLFISNLQPWNNR
jgi:hypothetical protein